MPSHYRREGVGSREKYNDPFSDLGVRSAQGGFGGRDFPWSASGAEGGLQAEGLGGLLGPGGGAEGCAAVDAALQGR